MMSKELFWNEIENRWKGEFEMFSEWIDKYKHRPECEGFFYPSDAPMYKSIKFHDLPDAMQIGIFYQYTLETACQYPFIIEENDSIDKIKENIKEWFCEEADAAYRDHLEGKYADDAEL